MTRIQYDPACIFAAMIALISVLALWDRSTQYFGLDFYQFWVVGQEIQKPAPADIYSDAWRADIGERYWIHAHRKGASTHETAASDIRRVLQTYSTPLLYTFFSLIGTHDYAQSLMRYQLISFASGIAALAIVCRLLGFSPTTTLLMIAALFGWGEAYRSEVFCANVNQVQFFAIACLLWIETSRRDDSRSARDILAGALLAIIVLFKPNIAAIAALLGLVWLRQGRYAKVVRHGVAFGLIAIAIVIVTSLRVGSSHCWAQWFGAVHELERETLTPQGENYSLAAVVLARIGYPAARMVTFLIPCITFGVFVLRRAPRHANPGADLHPVVLAVALGAALSPLASPFAWLHYFVLASPLLLVVLQPGQDRESKGWYRLRVGIGILSLVLICQSPIVNDLLAWDGFPAISLRMASAVTLLFAVVLTKFWRDSLPAWAGLSWNVFRRSAHVTS